MDAPVDASAPGVAELLATVEALRTENQELREQVRLSAGQTAPPPLDDGYGRMLSDVSEATSQSAATASAHVRRKKDAIDMEMGKAAYRAPAASSCRNLFNRSDVLPFEEDSPVFRLKIDELEESVDELRIFSQQLVDSCRHYCKHGHAAVEAGREFSSLLASLRSEAWQQRFGRVSTLLAAFGDTFEEIESYREVLLNSLEETFCAPMEEFVRLEVRRVRQLKQDAQKASAEMETSLVKYLRHRHPGAGGSAGGHTTQESQEKWDAQLSVLRQSHELARYDMVVELNSQKSNRKFQLCQRVCTTLYSHLGYFQQCHGVLSAVEPAMDQLNTELALARKEFSSKGMLYNLKRKLLLREVKRSSPALALLLPKRKRGSFQSDVVVATPGYSTYAPVSLLPHLGLDMIRRPSLEGKTSRRPSAEPAHSRGPSADAAPSLAKMWSPDAPEATSPTGKKIVAWGRSYDSEDDHVQGEEPPDEIAGSTARPPLFGQVGEIEGLRMSQYLGSRGTSSAELNDSSGESPMTAEQCEVGPPQAQIRARSSSSDASNTAHLGRVNSNAGEIITTAVASPLKSVVADSEAGDEPPLVERQRNKSISVHSIYNDSSRTRKVSPIRMQGYLWKQSNNISRDWHRRWFIIEGGYLWYMQTDTGTNKALIGPGIVGGPTAASRDPSLHVKLLQAVERKLVCSLLISTVKEMKNSEFKFCWQVISPGKRVYVLQAESQESYNLWVAALRAEIEASLSMVQTHGAHSSQVSGSNSLSPNVGMSREISDDRYGRDDISDSTIVLSEGQQDTLRKINPTCADCGRDGPEWASANNGIMLCIECCGVHRSLGTHVSKIRSLRLDRWTPHSVQLLVEIGNDRFNSIFERKFRQSRNLFPRELVRPTPTCSRAERVAFITAKYLNRDFVDGEKDGEKASAGLIRASGAGDIVGMLEALGAGADVNTRTADATVMTALHCACRGGHALAVELLCQMNARVDIVDALGKTASDYIDNENVAVIDTLYTNVENELYSLEDDTTR